VRPRRTAGSAGLDAAPLAALTKRIGHPFKDPDLLGLALTHRSFAHEVGERHRNNETLEFLGDAVLGFVVAEALRRDARAVTEVGLLSRWRSSLVSEASLAPRAVALGIDRALRLGKGEEATGGRQKPSILSDAFEAVVAAVYLDGGMRAARAFILRQFPEGIRVEGAGPGDDPKTRLQEIVQSRGDPLPEYRVASQVGPDHDRSFTVELLLSGKVVARGRGRTKKAAGVEAARAALASPGISAPRRRSRALRPPGGGKG
jgi:ribonuclease-3